MRNPLEFLGFHRFHLVFRKGFMQNLHVILLGSITVSIFQTFIGLSLNFNPVELLN